MSNYSRKIKVQILVPLFGVVELLEIREESRGGGLEDGIIMSVVNTRSLISIQSIPVILFACLRASLLDIVFVH